MPRSDDRRPCLVLGGTGHYGSQIVARLLERNQPVRVLSRDGARAREILGPGPEITAGDIRSRDAIATALDGATSMVIAVSSFTRKTARHRTAIERDAVLASLDQASRAGVRRVVYLSGYDVREELLAPLGLLEFGRPMLDVQAALRASDLDWTVLGCSPSMELFFSMIRGDTMTVPGGGPPALPTIGGRDVGAIAAQAVMRDDLSGQHIRLPGPEALSFPEAARRISEVWGRSIRVRKIPLAPLRIAAVVTRPFNPFLRNLVWAVTLMNNFPADIVAQVPEDHARLRRLFDYEPTTLEMEARRRMRAAAK